MLRSKEEVQVLFQKLLKQNEQNAKKINTLEEQAQIEKEKELVTQVSDYTSESIINNLANLQLDLDNTLTQITYTIKDENKKVDNLKRAITIQELELERSNNTQVASDALYILKKEHKHKTDELNNTQEERISTLETEISEAHTLREKEQTTFDNTQKGLLEALEKNREKESEKYSYELNRKYLTEKDNNELKKKLLLRKLNENQTLNDKEWAEREKEMSKKEEEFKEHKEKVDNFEEEQKEKCKAAKDKAMQQASRETKNAMELYQKEVEGDQLVANLKIGNFNKLIEDQKEEISQLAIELKEALKQVQELSLRAVDNSKAKLN